MAKPDVSQVYEFLTKVDRSFPIPLSHKQSLSELSRKFCDKATLCTRFEGDSIVAMVAGYTEDLVDGMAYISVVATLEGFKGRGYASELIGEFVRLCREKGIEAVHLYTHATNRGALCMYKKLGFTEWEAPNEARPEDVHLKYLIKRR